MSDALSITVTSADLRQMYVDLKAAESDLGPELRRGITAAAKPVVVAVQRKAGWSSRIPGAVKAKTSFSASNAGVSITVNSKTAPEAAALNNGDQSGTFRHPVFASGSETRDQWTWVTQQAQPFFAAGIAAADADINAAMLSVLDAIAKKAGFR